MKTLMTLVLVLLLAGCAAGQGGAGQTPAEEETTARHAEETTAHKEETTTQKGAGGRARPPDSTLSYGGQEVKGTLGSYCWTSGSSGGCADSIWPLIPSKQKTLTVPSGSEMVFRYGGQSPPKVFRYGGQGPPKTDEVGAYSLKKLQKTGTFRPDSTLKAHGSGVQRTIPAELPPGEYVLEVLVKEQQDDASYYFRVMVE